MSNVQFLIPVRLDKLDKAGHGRELVFSLHVAHVDGVRKGFGRN